MEPLAWCALPGPRTPWPALQHSVQCTVHSLQCALWVAACRLDLLETGSTSRQLWAPSLHLPQLVPALEAEAAASASREPAVPTNESVLHAVAVVAAAAVAVALAASGRPRAACLGTIASAVAVGARVTRGTNRAALHAVDLGCGRGRDCIWLAQRGWSVVGVDNQPAFLEHLAEFAARQQLGALVRCECRELKKGKLDPSLLQARNGL